MKSALSGVDRIRLNAWVSNKREEWAESVPVLRDAVKDARVHFPTVTSYLVESALQALQIPYRRSKYEMAKASCPAPNGFELPKQPVPKKRALNGSGAGVIVAQLQLEIERLKRHVASVEYWLLKNLDYRPPTDEKAE